MFSTLYEEVKTAMSEFIVVIVSCFGYAVPIRSFANHHEFDAEEELSEKVDPVLADAPYNV